MSKQALVVQKIENKVLENRAILIWNGSFSANFETTKTACIGATLTPGVLLLKAKL